MQNHELQLQNWDLRFTWENVIAQVSNVANRFLVFALQFAADVKAEVVGKPSPTFFNSVLEDMDVGAENVRTIYIYI